MKSKLTKCLISMGLVVLMSTTLMCSAIAAQTELVVWDYYGMATPILPLIPAFEAENPDIKIKYEALDWGTTYEKFGIVMAAGNPPGVVTLDATWLPQFAGMEMLADLSPYAQGKINGVPVEEAFSKGICEALTPGGKLLGGYSDFDVYCLYYRFDLYEEVGAVVPENWDELVQVNRMLTQDTDGDGQFDQYGYTMFADTFRLAQFLFDNGGQILTEDNTRAAFDSPEGIEAFQFFTDMVIKHGTAINWTVEWGQLIQGIKGGTFAMFSDGPYMMGVIKEGAPEMDGKWRVAPHPKGIQRGSYLGGTVLGVPANFEKKDVAWKYIEFMLREENQVIGYEASGAAPGLLAALENSEVSKPDPYFGYQNTLPVFKEALKTAVHYPYVKQWGEIDGVIATALEYIFTGVKTVEQSVRDAAAQVNTILAE